VPIALTAEQLALQASVREWAKRTGTIGLARDGEVGGAVLSGQDWASVAELGVFGVGMPAAFGGAGGSTADLAAVLAQLTESLVPGPILPTVLAARVLVRDAGELREFDAILRSIAAGEITVAVALGRVSQDVRTGAITAEPQPDGSARLTGQADSVLGGGSTTHLLVRATVSDEITGGAPLSGAIADGASAGNDAWYLLPVGRPGVTVTARQPADFSRSLADVAFDGVAAGRDECLPGVATSHVRDTAAALFAVEAAAVANWCTRTAAEYAAIRQQFGRPIGAFQAVKHLCASMACRAETAAVLAWDAARAIDEDPAELSLAAAAAAAFCLDAAVDVAKDCIQVLGGIGFTWEHDAHLYLRRAIALRQLLGGSSAWRERTAALSAAGVRRSLTLDRGGGEDGERAAARAAARVAAARIRQLPASAQRAALADSGYAAPSWPPPYGLAATPADCLAIDEELATAGLTRPDLVIGGWAMAAILGHGTTAQQDRFAGQTLRGEITWCQLFSEPEAGSDLASLRTRADRVDGGWLLTGQKVWTSLAREADWAICLARTDSSVPRHKGLTFFLVAMGSPGIDIRPLREITDRQMFNQVFLDEVFVPDDCVVGQPGEGWRVARTTLASERVAMGTGSSVGDAAEGLLELAAATGAVTDPVARQRIGALVAEGMAASLLDLQAVMATRTGGDPNSLAAVRKLVGVGHRQAAAEAALELAGTADAAAVQDFLLTRCLSIAGGTTQILLSLVGERLLGLPRES
jgi:alkylation response protein AidB-like acyl-CoA dehydrogenase